MGKPRATHPDSEADETESLRKAFRRMAFLMGNMVCGIWLVLFLASAALDENRPDPVSIILLLFVSAPLAYGLPYGIVRLIGLAVAAFRGRAR